MTIVFTPEQQALIQTESGGFFEACPGAGKTQTIVERFVRRGDQEGTQRGVALITFTNAAAEEAQRRCAHKPELLQAPNFVGTIDSFINRFFAAPFYKAKIGRNPTFWDSWSSLDIAKVNPVSGKPLSLDEFKILRNEAKLRKPEGRGYSSQDLKLFEKAAYQKWIQLVRSGHVDTGTSRLLAKIEIEEQAYGIVDLLKSRFKEVIVDEVQDCNSTDLLILKTLKDAGIRLITVGDIDQSIYEFRDSFVPEVRTFVRSGNPQPRINTNFRSSPAICKIVDSLRNGSSSDTAGGRAASCSIPVHVLGYQDPSEIGSAVHVLMEKYQGLATPVFLAHAATNAAIAAGGRPKDKDSTNKVAVLARSCRQLADTSSTAANRSRALTDIGLILQRLHLDKSLRTLSEADFLEELGLIKSGYRELCLRFGVAAGDPSGLAPRAYRKRVVQAASMLGIDIDPGSTRTPDTDSWVWEQEPQSAYRFEHSTIHQYKGLETDSVVLIIPPGKRSKKTLREWRDGVDSEPRRVLYVGASRAERLLILAVHNSLQADVTALLARDGVPQVVST